MLIFTIFPEVAARRTIQSIYLRYEKMIYRIARSAIDDPNLVEDAVQEIWLQATMSRDNIMRLEASQIRGYLSVLAKNVCVDMRNKKDIAEELPEDWDKPDLSMNVDIVKAVTRVIRNMPVQYRDILERKFVLGYSNREIARSLGMKESTVASRVMRGRSLLAEILREEGFNESGLDI